MAIACSSVQGENIGTSADPIIKGKDSTSDQDAVVLIVKLDFKSGIGACTGTLIAPNLVLTARHCVSNVASAPFGCKEDGTLYPFFSNSASSKMSTTTIKLGTVTGSG